MVPDCRDGGLDAIVRGNYRLPSRDEQTTTRSHKERNFLMKKHLPTTLQALGSSIVAVSLAIVSIPLGLAFAGIAFIVFGIAAERGQSA
jgi:hypothetical protein